MKEIKNGGNRQTTLKERKYSKSRPDINGRNSLRKGTVFEELRFAIFSKSIFRTYDSLKQILYLPNLLVITLFLTGFLYCVLTVFDFNKHGFFSRKITVLLDYLYLTNNVNL